MSIASNLAIIQDRMADACRRGGRSEADVALMAVSKMHPVAAILEAHAAGLRQFGENRVQEFAEKAAMVRVLPATSFHLIGPLQSNKTARAAELFDTIDTVDSVKVAQRLNGAAEGLGRKLPILIEVKLSPEETKHGVAPEQLAELLAAIRPLEFLEASGLMTVPPWSIDPETARPYFQQLRRLRDEHRRVYSNLTQLSMGMSNDYAVAIEEGSTCVRIGTALFGKRSYPKPGG